jgi:hypothetical protein
VTGSGPMAINRNRGQGTSWTVAFAEEEEEEEEEEERKKTLECVRNEVNKTIQFVRLQCWYY